MGVNPKLAHLNCHHAMSVANKLSQDILFEEIDIVSLNEPYVSEGSVLGIPNG